MNRANAYFYRRYVIPGLLLCCLLNSGYVVAADPPIDEDDINVTYLYAAVLGTGLYRIKDRNVRMFRIPFSKTRRQATETQSGWKWLLPVVVGYDDFSGVEGDLLERYLPDELTTLTFLPGIEYSYPMSSRWLLKPFVQLGVARDFSINETIWMTQFGLRSLSLFELDDNWELRWGNALRWAAEYQANSKEDTAIGIFETGLDIRHDLPFNLFNQANDMGGYYIYQRLMSRSSSELVPSLRDNALNLNEIGISLGLKQPRKLLGIDIQRIRVGYKHGGSFQGWVFGTEFPF